MRTILTFFIGIGLTASLIAGCGDDGGGGGVSVVATTPQVADLVRNVAGDRAEVTQILPANADPHEYEPTPSDAEALAGADLIVRSGGEVDDWLDQLVESSGTDAPVLVLIDHVKTVTTDGDTDPHWWQDPRNAVLAVAAIRDEVDDVDPGGAGAYDANARRYIGEIERLDRAIASCIDRVPPAQRKLVTSHDALGYYAARYGIDVIGAAIPALTTQAQASAGETSDLIALIRSEEVNAIFPEAGVSPALEQAIADEAGATVGGQLWADTLGPEDTAAATYLGSLRANTRTLVEGFSAGKTACDLP
ncbi:MAG: metal ABC transporter substrate-binding protein [Solirubrobacterales bacterium]|nr:zinc ABC transporter substrate-binding protein [Solirubrobacterales bacterium]